MRETRCDENLRKNMEDVNEKKMRTWPQTGGQGRGVTLFSEKKMQNVLKRKTMYFERI